MVDLRFRDIVRFSCGCNMVADFELKKLVKPLQDWFDGHARVLPWRDDPKAYKVWISEIMLQQTRVEAVKPYFARFMEALPDVEALAACPEDRYLKLWEGLGYYNRVRNLHAAAEQIMEQEGITKELKSRDQMEWVRRANNARSRVDEIILNELVYV